MHSVLLVDDSGLFRETTEALARRTNCRTLTASGGSDALVVARREKPELIFLDAAMSGMTGADVCRVLKADPRFARTPVVLAVGDEESAEAARRAGADGTIPRAFDETLFFDTLRKFLEVFPRSTERSSVRWEVTFWRDGVQHNGTIRDLSRGGFFVRTGARQPIGARVEISFEIPGKRPARTVVAEAIVVRIGQDPDRGLGCRFFRLTEGCRSHLEDCLRLLSISEPGFPVEREAGKR